MAIRNFCRPGFHYVNGKLRLKPGFRMVKGGGGRAQAVIGRNAGHVPRERPKGKRAK